MKISELTKILKQAQKKFGDVPVTLMDSETGDWIHLKEIVKLHPYNNYGCLNRSEPVNAIGLSNFDNNASDLVLNKI